MYSEGERSTQAARTGSRAAGECHRDTANGGRVRSLQGEPRVAILQKEVRGLTEERDACAVPPKSWADAWLQEGRLGGGNGKCKGPEAEVCSAGAVVPGVGVGWAERKRQCGSRRPGGELGFSFFFRGIFFKVFIAFVTISLLF